MPKLIIIDAHSSLHRAYHAIPPLTTSRGEPVNALLGFTRMTLKLLTEHKPDFAAVCFDAPGPTFRDEIYPEYKATRRETDAELKVQFPPSREMVKAMGLAGFEVKGFEADDLIATLAKKAEARDLEVLIVSSDKDILQLVSDRISVLNEPKDTLFNPAKVLEIWGVGADRIVEVLALMGDASDNVPGVEGVGEKTAVKLLREFGTIAGILARPDALPGKLKDKILSSRDQIRKSIELVRLRLDAPISIDWDALKTRPLSGPALLPLLKRYEFHSLARDLESKGAVERPKAAKSFSGSYRTVLTRGGLDEVLSELEGGKTFAVDLETTGLDPYRHEIVGVALSWAGERAAYIPIGHRALGSPEQLDAKTVLDRLRPVLEDPKSRIAGHNLKFDFSFLARAGLRMKNLWFDSMIASYCLDPSRPTHGLKDLADEVLGRTMTRIEDLFDKKPAASALKSLPMDELPVEKVAPYACADADCSLRRAEARAARLKERKCEPLFYDLEMPLVEILADMELAGIRVDPGELQKLNRDFGRRILELEREARGISGTEFNLNSQKQLSEVLFVKLGLPPVKKTKTGFSTDEEVLTSLARSHKLPQVILEHRELSKLRSTFVEGLLAEVRPENSRIHTSFNQAGTATGRLSSSDPNLQNIPIRTEQGRMIRRAFVPEEGMVFLSADYSQIDLRVLAHLSGDPALGGAFRHGADIHRSTAAEVFRVPESRVSEEQRNRAKAINFGIVYGQQAYGLSQSLGMSMAEAQEMIDSYFQKYPGVKEWIERTKAEARDQGSVRTLLGRSRALPELRSKNGPARAFAERVAVNTPVQGTSADIIKAAMIRLAARIRREKSPARMLLQVHDDLLFEVPKGALREAAEMVRVEMENAVRLSVPVLVDLKTGANWADMKALEVPR